MGRFRQGDLPENAGTLDIKTRNGRRKQHRVAVAIRIAAGRSLVDLALDEKKSNQIFIILVVLRRSVERVAGPISAA